jgi:SNF2 family DNA or RNA helicase
MDLTGATAVKLDMAYGRLYAAGEGIRTLERLPGTAVNPQRRAYELTLTLENLRAIRDALGYEKPRFWAACSPALKEWARIASQSERLVADLHARLDGGHRREFPWCDQRAGNEAPGWAPVHEVEDGRWKYRGPFEHQRVMATVAAELDGCAFLAEMGTAKTRSAVEALQFHVGRGAIDVALVLCPARVMGTWEREIQNWGDGTTLRPVMLAGSIDSRVKLVRGLIGEDVRGVVLILNYEAMPHKRMVDALDALFRAQRCALLCDEMHRVKNAQAKTTKGTMRLAHRARWRLGLTGTLYTNGLEDVWSQWYVVDLGLEFGPNLVQFRRQWMRESFDGFGWDARPGSEIEVGKRLRKRGVRYRKDECLDLPPKVYQVQHVELSAEQKKAYSQMEEELIAEIGEGDDAWVSRASITLTKFLRLSQITSGHLHAPDGSTHRFKPNPKLDALLEILRETEDQVLVWAWFREDVRMILDALRDMNVGSLAGDDYQNVMDRFQRGELRVVVGNPASGGLGLTLTAASTAIYYSQGFGLEVRSQSEDRCHRAGSERHRSVTYIDLIARGSIDEMILQALVQKKTVAELVQDLRLAVNEH